MAWPRMATTGLAEVDTTISAGVFVTRLRGGQGETEVLIMQRGWVMGWQFAKGRLNKKDQGNLVKCAFRALKEEIGVVLRYWPPPTASVMMVGREKYLAQRVPKEVHWFHFHSSDGEDFAYNATTHDSATRGVRWVTLRELQSLNVQGDQAGWAAKAIRRADRARKAQGKHGEQAHGCCVPHSTDSDQQPDLRNRQRPAAAALAAQPKQRPAAPLAAQPKQGQRLKTVKRPRDHSQQLHPSTASAYANVMPEGKVRRVTVEYRQADGQEHAKVVPLPPPDFNIEYLIQQVARRCFEYGEPPVASLYLIGTSSRHHSGCQELCPLDCIGQVLNDDGDILWAAPAGAARCQPPVLPEVPGESEESEEEEEKPVDKEPAACQSQWMWDAMSGGSRKRTCQHRQEDAHH